MLKELDQQTLAALKAHEDSQWDNWTNYCHLSDIKKTAVFISHVLEITGVTITAVASRNPLVCVGVPAVIALNTYILKKLDDKADKYWKENWMEPFRTLREDPSQVVLDDIPVEDITYPRLPEKV